MKETREYSICKIEFRCKTISKRKTCSTRCSREHSIRSSREYYHKNKTRSN